MKTTPLMMETKEKQLFPSIYEFWIEPEPEPDPYWEHYWNNYKFERGK